MYREYKKGVQTVTETAIADGLSHLFAVSNGVKQKHVDPDIVKTVQQCWDAVDRQCVNYRAKCSPTADADKSGWHTVRIFVSSTFTDFFCEREVLVKKVFPELREWCRERMLYLIECDMRWGVPRDTTTADTIAACLEELDRCREETDGEPFFLNLLGERYGWIPAEDDIPAEIKTQYGWVPQSSITFMEVLHGVYKSKSPNSVFLLRDSDILAGIPDEHLSRFKDTDPLAIEHLKQFRMRLLARFPNQVINYRCRVDGLISKYDRETVNLVDLETFADEVLRFFKSAIEGRYAGRDTLAPLSFIDEESANQKKVIDEMAVMLKGRQAETELLMSYIHGNTDGFESAELKTPCSREPKYWEDFLSGTQLLCVTGVQGSGKSTLLAWLTLQAEKQERDVFYHFCGATGSSHKVELLLQRLLVFLTPHTSTESVEGLKQLSVTDLRDKLKLALHNYTPRGDHQGLIVLDALDQLSSAETINHLSWLPPALPSNLQCVVSTKPHPPTVSRLQEHPHYVMTMGPLGTDSARLIIEHSLFRYSKKLDEDQMDLLLNSACSRNPLWLYLVCEELRTYGDFRTLTKKIRAVATSVEGMLGNIFRRLISEDDTGYLQKTLCILACANCVLTELDLMRILGNIQEREPIPTLLWTKVRRSLRTYLRIANYNDQVIFVHGAIKQAVYDTVIETSADLCSWHTVLADYIEYWSADLVKKTDDLPYHLQRARLLKRLVHFVRECPDAGRIPDFLRSQYIRTSRCHQLADPVVNKITPVYICTFCKMSKAVFNPHPYIPKNKDMCVVCGNHIRAMPFTTDAHLCVFHSVRGGFGPPSCFLCRRVTDTKSSVHGRLCNYCGFGNYGKQCIALEFH